VNPTAKGLRHCRDLACFAGNFLHWRFPSSPFVGPCRVGLNTECHGIRGIRGAENGLSKGHAMFRANRRRASQRRPAPSSPIAIRARSSCPRNSRRKESKKIPSEIPSRRELSGEGWRMGWDSNPRDPCGPAGFQDRCLQPLGHPSRKRNQILKRRPSCKERAVERGGGISYRRLPGKADSPECSLPCDGHS